MDGAAGDAPADDALGHHRPMLKTVARILLLRVLPRRVLPIVTVVEAALFLRSIRNRSRLKVNPPSAPHPAAPGPLPTSTTVD